MRLTLEAPPRANWVDVRVATFVLSIDLVVSPQAAEFKPHTLEAFDRYVATTEARMRTEFVGDSPFLWVDPLADNERDATDARLRAGEVVIERLKTRDGDADIDVPDGSVHHWGGTIVIPGVTLDDTIALVQDHDHYAEIYGLDVQESRLVAQDRTRFRVYF